MFIQIFQQSTLISGILWFKTVKLIDLVIVVKSFIPLKEKKINFLKSCTFNGRLNYFTFYFMQMSCRVKCTCCIFPQTDIKTI